MVVALRAMSASESAQFIVVSREVYLAERVTAGEDPEVAARAVAEMSREVFPDDKPAPGHLLFAFEEVGRRVGTLWIGPGEGERPGEWWIWDIVIDESCRVAASADRACCWPSARRPRDTQRGGR
jgi:hypothetical protein